MKKIYRILILVSFLFVIGIIVFFFLKITPKIKTKIYKDNVDYYVLLNTNKLNNKTSTVDINNQEFKVDLTVQYQQNNFFIYHLAFHDLKIELQNNVDSILYLPNTSLFKYLTNKN